MQFWRADPRGVCHRVGTNRDKPNPRMTVGFFFDTREAGLLHFCRFHPESEMRPPAVASYLRLIWIARLSMTVQRQRALASVEANNHSFGDRKAIEKPF
jgi:hypothetical protein